MMHGPANIKFTDLKLLGCDVLLGLQGCLCTVRVAVWQ